MSDELGILILKALTNPVFLSGIFSWFIAQILKSLIELFKRRPHSAKEILLNFIWTTGGMPSSHCAVVSALATAIGFSVGIDTALFAVSFFYALLTIRDALGVRRAAGSQAKALNQLISELYSRMNVRIKSVKEIHGHTVAEVSVGIFIGFFMGVAFATL